MLNNGSIDTGRCLFMYVVKQPLYIGITLANCNELGKWLVCKDLFAILASYPAKISTITFTILAE